MNKENLMKLRDICMRAIDASDVDIIDRNEVLMNIYHFLAPDDYEKNLEILRRRQEDERKNILAGNNRNKRGTS